MNKKLVNFISKISILSLVQSLQSQPTDSTKETKSDTAIPRRKMNVLFIAVDDLRPQLNCYGKTEIISPNIDRIASEGVLFKRAYCMQAICAPSRASLLAGARPDTTKIYDLDTPLRKSLPDVLSLPQHFKNNDYTTISVGKIYHHPKDDLVGWSEEPYRSTGPWAGAGYLNKDTIETLKNIKPEKGKKPPKGPAFEHEDVLDNAYPDGKNVEYAISKLRELKKNNKLFFFAMGFHKPHLPFISPKKYWDMYSYDNVKLSPNPFLPKNAPTFSFCKPTCEIGSYNNIPAETPFTESLQKDIIRSYYSCVTYTDTQIGLLLKEVEDLGLKNDTIVILWGDHGWKLGDHGCWGKHTNYEIDTNAPLIISVHGMKNKNVKLDALVEFIDIYPTLCELTTLEIPKHTEGVSFVPLLDNPQLNWKRMAISQYPKQNYMGYSMKVDNYRYIEWREKSTDEVKVCELYDHKNDPLENNNIAGEKKSKDVIERLSKMLAEGYKNNLPVDNQKK